MFSRKNEKENELYKDYPTAIAFYERIKQIQSEELKSDRYMLAYSYLTNNYWNRKNKKLEEELFKIIGTSDLEDSMFDKSDEYRKSIKMKKYETLKQFMTSLSKEQINSNIFLKSSYLFMDMSSDVCLNIMTDLYDKINNENISNLSFLEFPIPKKTQELIPNYIPDKKGIKYYRPQAYKIELIDVLDLEHKYVYDDYNSLVNRIGKLAEEIYYLQLNEIVSKIPNLECYYFQLYHPGYNNHFNISFFNSTKQNNLVSQEIEFTPTDEFIKTTVTSFKKLLDMGLIDVSVLEDKNTEYVLKKKLSETK